MSRRPVDRQNRFQSKSHGQQAVWAEVRRQRDFTVADIANRVDMKRDSVREYIKRLQAGGYVEQAEDFQTSWQYRLVKDTGQTAPRLRKDGSPVTQGAGVENLWRAMRMNPQFTIVDLMALSNTETTRVKDRSVRDYVGALVRAGYLRVVRKANPAIGQTALYRLVRNTGPKPPQIQRVKQVFDPNLGEVVSAPGVKP